VPLSKAPCAATGGDFRESANCNAKLTAVGGSAFEAQRWFSGVQHQGYECAPTPPEKHVAAERPWRGHSGFKAGAFVFGAATCGPSCARLRNGDGGHSNDGTAPCVSTVALPLLRWLSV